MTPEQARAARAFLKIGVREVAAEVGMTPNTVSRIEAPIADGKRGPQKSTVLALRAWYEGKGITFLSNGEASSGQGVCFNRS